MKKIVLNPTLNIKINLFISLLFLVSSIRTQAQEPTKIDGVLTAKGGQAKIVSTIAFGGCNNQVKEQVMWKYIGANKPDIWLWLGDNIYCDTEDMTKKKQEYDKVKYHPEYQKFIKSCKVHGIYDDHDYGVNDIGKEYGPKTQSCELFLNFIDVPKSEPVWNRPGIYSSYCYNAGDSEIKIIMLDTRFFRDKLLKNGKDCIPNPTGDTLGEDQWAWLEKELSESTARVNIIASGFQFLPDEHNAEKWANFPKARQRLLKLLAKYDLRNIVLISGDRHMAETSKIKLENGRTIYEFTSSGLTHFRKTPEPNRYRQGKPVCKRNFAVMKFDWDSEPAQLRVLFNGLGNKNYLITKLDLR